MRGDAQSDLKKLRVDGGVTNSDHFMQILSDIGNFTVERPEMRESTALGSALLAGSAMGLFGWDMADPRTLQKVNARAVASFAPALPDVKREKLWRGWKRAVERSRAWREPESEDEDEMEKERSLVSSLGATGEQLKVNGAPSPVDGGSAVVVGNGEVKEQLPVNGAK